jgi:CheY-like chemotaxis protein
MAIILIIDDSTYMRSKISGVLKTNKHIILEAENGHKGLQMIREHSPDCIILDLIIPEIDGLKILKALYDQHSKTPVIVVTADIQETVRKKCLELGAKAFINKPPKEDDLRNTVENVLGFNKDTPK